MSTYEKRPFWIFTPESNACPECQEMGRHNYHQQPVRPHPNCNCIIEPGEVECREVSRKTECHVTGHELKPIGPIPKNSSRTMQVNSGTTSSRRIAASGSASAGGKGTTGTTEGTLGITFGASAETSTSDSSGTAETVNFVYDPEVSGSSQMAYGVYEVRECAETIKWVTSPTFASAYKEVEFETQETWTEKTLVGYEQIDSAALYTGGEGDGG